LLPSQRERFLEGLARRLGDEGPARSHCRISSRQSYSSFPMWTTNQEFNK
jgi:hypothetical protein